MPYNDRLVWLQLSSLELRRIRKDLIMFYKIMHGHVTLELSDFLSYLTIRVLGVIIFNCLKSNFV